MAQKITSISPQTPESISALAVLERTRTDENDKTVKRIARNYLGHFYDKENNQIKEIAIDEAQDGDVVVQDPKSHYVASFGATSERACENLQKRLKLDIGAGIGPLSSTIQTGLNIGETHTQDSTTVVCAVACVRTDRCSLQKMNQLKTSSYPEYCSGIVKSILVYAGYKIVLEIVFSGDRSEGQKTVGVKVEGSTPAKVFSGSIDFGYENSSLKDRSIERINIKEVSSIGGYRVPFMEFASHDFHQIQRTFESIRSHFGETYCSIADRLILVNPDHDLVPWVSEFSHTAQLREITSGSEGHIFRVPITYRDDAYYNDLALQMDPHSKLSEYLNSEALWGYERYGLKLDRILYAIATSFSELLQSPVKEKTSQTAVLMIGTDMSTIDRLRIQLTGGGVQKRKALYPSGHTESAVRSGVCVYDNVLVTPILTNRLNTMRQAEDDICLGQATALMIDRFAPRHIIVCIPRDFFQCQQASDLVPKVVGLYDSLSRIVNNPKSIEESILFVIDDQDDDPHGDSIQKDIFSAHAALNAETNKGWLSSLLKSFFRYEEIEEALEAYAFIVNRLVRSSKINMNESSSQNAPNVSFYCEFNVSKNEQGKYVVDKQYGINEALKALTLEDFNIENMTLHSSSCFEVVLTCALRHIFEIEAELCRLEGRFIADLELLKSLDRIVTLFNQEKIFKTKESEEILGTTLSDALDLHACKQKELEDKRNENVKQIADAQTKNEKLSKDTTPKPFKLIPDAPIKMRSMAQALFFVKKYTFTTNYKFSKCEFSKTPGTFNCIEAEFMNTKKAVFTPKYYGHEKDLRANIQIDIETKIHPETIKEIDSNKALIDSLKRDNESLESEIKNVKASIQEIKHREMGKLENRLQENIRSFLTLRSRRDMCRAEFMKHHEYYKILKKVCRSFCHQYSDTSRVLRNELYYIDRLEWPQDSLLQQPQRLELLEDSSNTGSQMERSPITLYTESIPFNILNDNNK